MPKKYSSVTCLTDSFKGVLLDAHGVFRGGSGVDGYQLIPGSKKVMEKLVAMGKIVGVLSNSTQLASKEVEKLRKQGFVLGTHFHFLITSGEIAREVFRKEKIPFKTPNKTFWLYGGGHPKYASPLALFEGSSYKEVKHHSEADFIYVSIPHINGNDQTNPEIFYEEIKALRKLNLPMVCANPDRFAHEGSPARPVVRQGSIAQIYQNLGGEVFYIGKPYSLAYESAMSHFREKGLPSAEEILMVGDTPETDIRGANGFHMQSALTTQTGIMADRISRDGFDEAIRQLSEQDRPTFFIEKL